MHNPEDVIRNARCTPARPKLGCVLLVVILLTITGRHTTLARDWPDRRVVGRFVLFADFPLDEHRLLITQLHQLQQDLASVLALPPATEPIQLFLFRDKASYEGYLKQYFPGVPQRRALFIKGRGPGMVFAYQTTDFEVDLRHESTHALLHTMLSMVPLWLDEGLAEYFEVPADQRANGNPHLSPTRWAARFYRMRPLTDLEQLGDVSKMGPGEYRAAWAWVHFMLHGPKAAHQQLVAYLNAIRLDQPPGKLSKRLEESVPNLKSQFLRHFRKWPN